MSLRSGRVDERRRLLFYFALAGIVTVCGTGPACAQGLHDAAKTGDIESVEAFLAKDSNVNVTDANGATALHYAAFKGKVSVLELLLSRGANLSAKDKWGDTPLHEAARGGHKDLVELLLSKGSDVNAQNDQGGVPLHYAVKCGNKSVVELLLAKGATLDSVTNRQKVTPLHLAASYGENDVASILLSKGANVNPKDAEGTTPLHLAAQTGNKDLVGILLEQGARVESQTNEGYTPLHFATIRGHKAVVELLIQKGANVNAKLKNAQQPRTPLIMAAWQQHKEIVKVLQEHGAKDDWLSVVPGFDPNNFRPLQLGVNKDGLVSVGSNPFFLASHYAARPWKEPDKLKATRKTGSDFFRWKESPEENRLLAMVVIEDKRGNKTYQDILLPAYLGEAAVVYRDGITSIADGGPFVNIKILWQKKVGEAKEPVAGGNVVITRGDKSITLKTDKHGSATHLFKEVRQNEPITAIFKSADGKVLSTVDFDCVGRGATPESVTYTLRREETKNER